MKKVVLAGGSGNLGTLLTKSFLAKGWQVVILSRQRRSSNSLGLSYVQWDGETLGDWAVALEGVDLLINMSGASINTRFTEENKKKLRDSRYLPTAVLGEAINAMSNPPALWINFSGISIFEGASRLQDETSTYQGSSFMAQLAVEWERVFRAAQTAHTRQVVLRLSPVLSPSAGMFAELYPLAKLGLGGTVGSGRQYISWIHEKDLVQLVHFIVDKPTDYDLYHACSPQPQSNHDFMQALRKELGVPVGLPLPSALAKVGAFAKGVDPSLLLETNPVTTKNTLAAGFKFDYADVHDAFKQLIKSL